MNKPARRRDGNAFHLQLTAAERNPSPNKTVAEVNITGCLSGLHLMLPGFLSLPLTLCLPVCLSSPLCHSWHQQPA
eukprot:m.79918 g.79918  ORF g.79918 m.79918 type:complete len:76 (+) comp14187_c1_seq1:86-313(+)